MKKKFIFFTMLLLTLMGGVKLNVLNAQTVEIGEGDGNSNQFPIYAAGSYEYSFTQQIYKASEIKRGAGTITSIAFKPYFDIEANRNLIVYLKNVEDDLLPAQTYSMNDITPVFSGEVTFGKKDDWSIIELTETFEYEGKNILVCINDVTGVTIGTSYFYAYNTNELRSIVKYRDNTPYDLTTESFNTSSMWGSTYCFKTNSQIKFTFGVPVPPSVEITPESIDLDTVRAGGEFFTENAFEPKVVTVSAKGGAIINEITTDNDFFEIEFEDEFTPGQNKYTLHINYNRNAEAGSEDGELVVTYDTDSTATIPLRAVAYSSATDGEAIENPIEVAFTDNAYTHAASGMHDDYILPGEENDGNNGDAVYTFTLNEKSLITANVEGTDPIVVIYNSDFGEKDGPSSDNNYEGIQQPSAPTTFGPFDFSDESFLDIFDSEGWYVYNNPNPNNEDGRYYLYGGSVECNLVTKTKYVITSQSKLSFSYDNFASGAKIVVALSTDGINFVNKVEIATSGNNSINLSDYAADEEVYISIKMIIAGWGCSIDNLALTDGSAKSYSRIDGVPYPAGDYYLVAAAEGNFTLNLSISELTAPAEFALTAPEDNAREQNNNPILAWEAAQYASSYNVYIGTSSDLSDVEPIVVTTNYCQTENLLNNTRYYWTVEAVNEQGTTPTTSPTRSFVTTLDVPQNISAYPTQIYEGQSTMISWSEPEHTDDFLYYNIYVNGVKKNLEGINLEDIPYEISGLDHNITGHEISVTAVYDGLGESGHAKCNVQVCGYGNMNITVKDGETPIKGATVVLNGTDEFGNAVEEFTAGLTDEAGFLLVENVKAGEYTVVVSIIGYEEKVVTGIKVVSGTPYEATISMQEKPTAPEGLLKDVAVAEFGGAAEVTWTGASGAQNYNIYRRNVETGVVEPVAENPNTTNQPSKTYIDAAYATLPDGNYQYGVTTMVDADEVILNEGFENGLPSGWVAPWNNAQWYVLNSIKYAYNGTYSAYVTYQYNGSKPNITTAVIDLTQNTSAKLSFYYKNIQGTKSANDFYVKIKKETEANWEEQIVTAYTVANYTKYEMSLDKYVGNRIQLSFEVTTYASAYTYLDEIVITGTKKTESAPVWSNTIKKGGIVFNNDGGDNSWLNPLNWSNDEVPANDGTAEVTIRAAATISSEVNVKYLAISGSGKLTLESTAVLTADELVNNDESSFIIKDGAQLFHNSNNVKASFTMGIVNPEGEWNENNKTGWQFIASPFTEAAVNDFVPAQEYNYDLYRYAGSANEEWDNQKDNYTDPSWSYFNPGEGYLASYDKLGEATLRGTLNSGVTYSWDNLTYINSKELANFHLVGNPFTFDMDITKATFTNLVEGVAIVNNEGGYTYYDETTIPVGDGFFVKATGGIPSLYYDHNASVSVAKRGSESNNSLNITATGNAGKDNVVINFAGKSEGFNKLQNFNDAIATVYVAEDGKNYGIYNCDADVQEVELYFNANKMGNYTISIEPNGEFETVTLVDRFTGVETNMLLEDYNFTAMSSDNHNRFIVRMVNGQQTTDNSHFVYQSGEELILNIQGDVQIVDVLGRVVYNGKAMNDINHINVSSFNSGAYMIRVMNGNDVKVEKVVIY